MIVLRIEGNIEGILKPEIDADAAVHALAFALKEWGKEWVMMRTSVQVGWTEEDM
jgi:hypothetical protein